MGDFQANFQRPSDSGIHTVEGNVAGSRAAALEKKRQLDQQEFERKKSKIASDAQRDQQSISTKFAEGSVTAQDTQFSEATVGLITIEQLRAIKEAQDRPIDESSQNKETEEEHTLREKAERKARKKALKEKKKQMATLSFADGIDDVDVNGDTEQGLHEQQSSQGTNKIQSNKKDPTIDTSFLPDKDRDAAVEAERQRLVGEWKQRQEQAKAEQLEVVYSYWDGSGHRRTLTCQKGSTIGDFLEQVRLQLQPEFRELGGIASDALLYVKEDLILPHDISFYDLIACNARGKSGPLFHFDVHEDIRVGALDVRVEKDESHPGKVVQRSWYDRNKHIFPASRWEVYDPAKDYGTYTIGGKVVN